jgi:hypothetical protein
LAYDLKSKVIFRKSERSQTSPKHPGLYFYFFMYLAMKTTIGKRNKNPFLSLYGWSIIRTNISGEEKIFQNVINHTNDVEKCIVNDHRKVCENNIFYVVKYSENYYNNITIECKHPSLHFFFFYLSTLESKSLQAKATTVLLRYAAFPSFQHVGCQ